MYAKPELTLVGNATGVVLGEVDDRIKDDELSTPADTWEGE